MEEKLKNHIHVVPIDDCIEHEESWLCPCEPKIDFENPADGTQVIVHNALDGREGKGN